ncbi:MAG: HAD family hydrolase [Candidatus Lokiarchaeia archaeon]
MKNYFELKLPTGEKGYVKKSSLELLEQLKSLIFDCDGVLIDVSDSFRTAIIKTTNWYITKIIGLGEISEDLVTHEETGLFKNSGGFNNDWHLTYGVILYFVTLLLIRLNDYRDKLLALIEGKGDLKSKMRRLEEFGDLCKLAGLDSLKLASQRFGDWSLKDYVGSLDVSGLPSAERIAINKLVESLGVTMDQALRMLEKLCLYRGTIFDFNIIKRYFEEIYSGNEVFENVYGIKPLFYSGTGLIENERLILRKEVLDNLISDLGFSKFGIASGRLRSQTLPVLQRYENLERYFNLDSSIFLEDIMSAEDALRKKGVNVKLEKPEPYSLLTVADKINPPGKIFGYVGDTASDIIASKRANAESNYSVLGIGVLCSASDIDILIKNFVSLDADIILPSPNDLSLLLTNLEMMKNENS